MHNIFSNGITACLATNINNYITVKTFMAYFYILCDNKAAFRAGKAIFSHAEM